MDAMCFSLLIFPATMSSFSLAVSVNLLIFSPLFIHFYFAQGLNRTCSFIIALWYRITQTRDFPQSLRKYDDFFIISAIQMWIPQWCFPFAPIIPSFVCASLGAHRAMIPIPLKRPMISACWLRKIPGKPPPSPSRSVQNSAHDGHSRLWAMPAVAGWA